MSITNHIKALLFIIAFYCRYVNFFQPNKSKKMKVFLDEHKDSWIIKDDRINFTNVNRMTEYYSLLNRIEY